MKADKRSVLTSVFAACGMGLLILDARTALEGAREAMELCIRTVIPSLFPFFFLSILLTGALAGRSSPLLAPLGRLCGLPKGGEPLLLVGLLGGYPVGAQSIAESYRQGQLSAADARRMLGFCSNAGPAFIFGMAASLFQRKYAAWALWGIHILSALLVGVLLPGKSGGTVSLKGGAAAPFSQVLTRALRVMAMVCGWVILFRVMIAFLQRWCLWLLPCEAQTTMIGLLELTNGCYELTHIPGEWLRFLLCACFLSFGGLCVAMQTVSVCAGLGTGAYFPGKLLQSVISFLLAAALQPLLFPGEAQITLFPWALASFPVLLLVFYLISKNKSSNPVTAGV